MSCRVVSLPVSLRLRRRCVACAHAPARDACGWRGCELRVSGVCQWAGISGTWGVNICSWCVGCVRCGHVRRVAIDARFSCCVRHVWRLLFCCLTILHPCLFRHHSRQACVSGTYQGTSGQTVCVVRLAAVEFSLSVVAASEGLHVQHVCLGVCVRVWASCVCFHGRSCADVVACLCSFDCCVVWSDRLAFVSSRLVSQRVATGGWGGDLGVSVSSECDAVVCSVCFDWCVVQLLFRSWVASSDFSLANA